jgi:hypothetical protein
MRWRPKSVSPKRRTRRPRRLIRGSGDKALVDEMLEIARRHANRPDARIVKLAAWIREKRRLLLFTEYEDTRRWLERRLLEALHDLGPASPASPARPRPICTDAAREGINLQARCHDLIHIDLPWNPARPEQRNARAVLE